MDYLLAYRELTGTDNRVFSTGVVAGTARATLWRFDNTGTARTLNASTPTTATATSVALATNVGGTWVGSWNVVGVAPSDQSNGARYDRPATTTAWDLTTYSDDGGALNAAYGIVASTWNPPTLAVVTYTVAAEDKTSPWAPQTADWVTFALGWTV
jgi:hypothetical protein